MYVTKRTEIACALSSGRFPVLKIDMETPKAGWEDVFEGCYVNVDCGKGSPFWGKLNYFGDERKFEIMPESVSITSGGPSYSDVIYRAELANAPLIKEGDIVTLLIDYPKVKTCVLKMMKVGKCSKFVYPICVLEEVEEVNLDW